MVKSAAIEAAMARTADVGVLFVHGIGRQARGAALEEGANAIHAALQSETKFDGVPIGDRLVAEFGPVDLAGPDAGPARANLLVRAGVDSVRQRWLLAESHWADAFRSPGLRATLAWILTVSPVLLLSRAVEGGVTAFRAWARWNMWMHWWRVVVAWLWVVLVAPVSIVLVAGLTLTVLLRFLIPIQFIKDLLGRLEVIVTAYLGDSYLFIGNEVSRSAMATRVAADIEWLTDRADRVVVVSHSQGAAVTALALASRDPVDTLITYGAGIGQLDWIRAGVADPKQRARRIWGFVLWVLNVLMFVPLAALVRLLPQPGTEWWMWVYVAFFGLGNVYTAAAVARVVAKSGRAPVGYFRKSARPQGAGRDLAVRWWDMWASADPVPGGPSTTYYYSDVDTFRVFNRGNFLTDHSTYYRNREEFVGRVLLAALQPLEGVRWSSLRGSVERETADYLAAALPLRSCLRQRRGRWLEAWRTGLAALAIAVMWRWWPQLTEGVGGSIEWLAGVFPAFAETIRAASDPALRIALAALVVALSAMIVYWVSLVLWWGWARVERRIVNSDLRLEELQSFGAQIRLSASQLPFIVMAAAAPTLAIGSAVFVLLVDAETIQRWFAFVFDLEVALIAFSMLIVLYAFYVALANKKSRSRAKAMFKKAALPVVRALPETVVRDPRQYTPFRHVNNQTRSS